MLLLELYFNTSIQVSPSVWGENPHIVVKQCIWVKSPYQTTNGLIPQSIQNHTQLDHQIMTQSNCSYPVNCNMTNEKQHNTKKSNLVLPHTRQILDDTYSTPKPMYNNRISQRSLALSRALKSPQGKPESQITGDTFKKFPPIPLYPYRTSQFVSWASAPQTSHNRLTIQPNTLGFIRNTEHTNHCYTLTVDCPNVPHKQQPSQHMHLESEKRGKAGKIGHTDKYTSHHVYGNSKPEVCKLSSKIYST